MAKVQEYKEAGCPLVALPGTGSGFIKGILQADLGPMVASTTPPLTLPNPVSISKQYIDPDTGVVTELDETEQVYPAWGQEITYPAGTMVAACADKNGLFTVIYPTPDFIEGTNTQAITAAIAGTGSQIIPSTFNMNQQGRKTRTQKLIVNEIPGAGTFVIVFGNAVTEPLAWNITASQLIPKIAVLTQASGVPITGITGGPLPIPFSFIVGTAGLFTKYNYYDQMMGVDGTNLKDLNDHSMKDAIAFEGTFQTLTTGIKVYNYDTALVAEVGRYCQARRYFNEWRLTHVGCQQS